MSKKQGGQILDDFWDLSSLVPPRKKASVTVPAQDTAATQITLVPPQPKEPIADQPLTEHYIFPHTAEELRERPEPDARYVPAGPLLHEVRIYRWPSEYAYYEQFCRHAARLHAREGTPCAEVDFFSYMPQYTQLSREQLDYYLWWRTNFREGKILPAAYSYLLLYLYEIIHLDALISPREGQESMVRLWLSYRERYPRLDALVREWLLDYSLLHRLPAPDLPRECQRELLDGCRLKEFYVVSDGGREPLAQAVLQFGNNYDYRKSKFYRPDTAEDFERVLGGAVRVALDFLQRGKGEKLMGDKSFCTVTRDAFSGALCSYRLKRKIEVDYTSFSRTHELRYVITDVLKYAENALRAALGIKSRLTVYEVSISLRAVLDEWLKTAVPSRPARQKEPKRVEIPDYERRYELPRTALSPERATRIEQTSWGTTERLVEAFLPENEQESAETVQNTPVFDTVLSPTVPPAEGLATALGELAEFVRLVAAGDADAQRAFALARHTMPDALVDRVNTLAEEQIGDIVLEQTDTGLAIIEDYRDLLLEEGVI
ncbi:MAG: TerB N-terminal domain-containing protein [Clostridia bacterium]|nr:TerB N-terminal domain-containing protein [Clostridia bacterium]